MNTWFNTHFRHRYTWISPSDRARNQINYYMINERYRTYISNARPYVGTNANSDHNSVIANIKIYLKVKKQSKRKSTFSLNTLHIPEIGTKFSKHFLKIISQFLKKARSPELMDKHKNKYYHGSKLSNS